MKAKLSSATSVAKGSSKASPSGQQERQPSGSLGLQGKQHSGGLGPDSRAGAPNGPLQHAVSGGTAAPADQRHLLPPLTPEEMRRQYAGVGGERGGLSGWGGVAAGAPGR